jgi:hypothetical protein
MSYEIIERVTPSGVKFSIRNLVGKDQDDLTKGVKKSGANDASPFNKMLQSSLMSLGSLSQEQIKMETVTKLLSIDRAFMLVVMRQHSLDFKKEFDFKYEWPLNVGRNEKESFDYSVNFTHENFPVTAPIWMRDKIAELKKENKDMIYPDGYLNKFPEIFASYNEMLDHHKTFEGQFPKSKLKYKWEVLDGLTESNFSQAMKDDQRINMTIEMRKPKVAYVDDKSSKTTWVDFETTTAHLQDVEHLRDDIRDKEGLCDTSLTIQHPSDITRRERVNLIQLPVFFFPSLAR